MENFLLQTDQVPGYAKDCVMYVRSVDRENLKKLLGKRLVKIKEAADDGARLTKQVCDAFDLLEQLINHVIEASSLTMSQKEKKRAFDFEQLMRTELKEKGGIKEDEKMQKGFDLCQLDIISDQNETLRKVLNDLGHLLAKWSSIHRFFNTIRNHFMEVTFPRLNEFTTDAGETLGDAYSCFLMGELNKSLKDLESCYKTHHSAAKLYVRVSDTHIMKNINLMQSMLSIPLSEVGGAQIKLMASCEEATKGIQEMYNEERAEATREIEKQNSSAGK
jgi:isopropylmalate/homocitrate/citramalate synthase